MNGISNDMQFKIYRKFGDMGKNDYLKCNTCANARPIISENGYHYTCMLPNQKGVDCLMDDYKHWETRITRSSITYSKDANVTGNLANRVDIGNATFVVTPDKVIKMDLSEHNGEIHE